MSNMYHLNWLLMAFGCLWACATFLMPEMAASKGDKIQSSQKPFATTPCERQGRTAASSRKMHFKVLQGMWFLQYVNTRLQQIKKNGQEKIFFRPCLGTACSTHRPPSPRHRLATKHTWRCPYKKRCPKDTIGPSRQAPHVEGSERLRADVHTCQAGMKAL